MKNKKKKMRVQNKVENNSPAKTFSNIMYNLFF